MWILTRSGFHHTEKGQLHELTVHSFTTRSLIHYPFTFQTLQGRDCAAEPTMFPLSSTCIVNSFFLKTAISVWVLTRLKHRLSTRVSLAKKNILKATIYICSKN